MKAFKYLIGMLLVSLMMQCDNTPVPGDEEVPMVTTGVLEVNFILPYIPLPSKSIHRVNLSIARTADSLYRGLFISSANVLDSKSIYRFVLTPGTYYYQAGITCSCLADSCLWGGFPGGRYGVRWAIDQVEVKLGAVSRQTPSFQ
ncbi:MAG: hypothetical protein WC699_09405 [Bacteroidales bacterium]|jgi:hypothetical protein